MKSSLKTTVNHDHDTTNENTTNSDNNHFKLQNTSSIETLPKYREQNDLTKSSSNYKVNSQHAIRQDKMIFIPKLNISTLNITNTLPSPDSDYTNFDHKSKSLMNSNPKKSNREIWVHPNTTTWKDKYKHDTSTAQMAILKNLTQIKLKLNNTIIHISNQQKKLSYHSHSLPPTCTQIKYTQPKSNLKLSSDIKFNVCINDIFKDSARTGWHHKLRTNSKDMNNMPLTSYSHKKNSEVKYYQKHDSQPHANSFFRNFITHDAVNILRNLKLLFPNNNIFSKISQNSLQIRLYHQKETKSNTGYIPGVNPIICQNQFDLFMANTSSHHFEMTKNYTQENKIRHSKTQSTANNLQVITDNPVRTVSSYDTNTDCTLRNYRPYSYKRETSRIRALETKKKYNNQNRQNSVKPTMINTPKHYISQILDTNGESPQTKLKFKIVSAQTKIKFKPFRSHNKVLDSRGFSEEEDKTNDSNLSRAKRPKIISHSIDSIIRKQSPTQNQYPVSNTNPMDKKVVETSGDNNALTLQTAKAIHKTIKRHMVDNDASIIHREKSIVKTLKNSDFKFISNEVQLHSFDDKLPRYIASCFTKHVLPTYFCDACLYQTGVKARFTQHHITQKHLNNLDIWVNNQVKSNRTPTIKDKLVCVNQSSTQTSEIVLDLPSNTQILVPENLENKNKTLLDISQIQDFSNKEMLILKSEEYIIMKITELIPNPYRTEIIEMVKILGISKRDNSMIITRSHTFTASEHWIAIKYSQLLSKNNPRDYLLDRWSNNDHSFVFKSHLERIEIQTISGAARVLFDILAPATIPIEYLCMLAVLMTDQKHLFFLTRVTLQDDHMIDLLLRNGVLTLSKLVTQRTSQNSILQTLLIPTRQQIATKFPNTIWEKPVIPIPVDEKEITRKILIQAEKRRNSSTLCIEGLQKSCTNKCLRKLFLPFGHITGIFKITKNTAIVYFSQRFKAKLAMRKLNGSTFEGQSITMTMVSGIQAPDIISRNRLNADIEATLSNNLSHNNATPTLDNVTNECQNISIDIRLQNFNDNAWEIIAMEDITLHPYSQYNIKVKISQDNLVKQFKSLGQQEKFVVTCGLCPYPQIIEGIYNTQKSITNITVRNSSQRLLTFVKGIPIQGLTAHTCNFVSQNITKHNPNQFLRHPTQLSCSHDLTQWHATTKTFQKMNAWKKRFNINNTETHNTLINYWNID